MKDAAETARLARRLLFGLAFALPVALLIWHSTLFTFICDDAFISFRYVRNLLEGHGLAFNPSGGGNPSGEAPVEGYTNFLWVLELAALWGGLGLRPEYAVHLLSGIATLVTVALAARLCWRGPSKWRGVATWSALALLATNRSVAVWSTGGLETRQFTALVLAGMILLLEGSAPLWASGVLGLAALTRPEGVLMGACGLAVATWWRRGEFTIRNSETRSAGLRNIASLWGPFALLVGAHALFRGIVYRSLVPNTFVAKHVRPWPEAGVAYFIEAFVEHGLYLLLPLALIGVLRRRRLPVLALAMLGPPLVFTCLRGGDHFEFRALDPLWVPLCVLAAEGLVVAARWRPAPSAIQRAALGVGLAITVLYTTAIPLTHELQFGERDETGEVLKASYAIDLPSAPLLLALPGMEGLLEPYNVAMRYTATRGIAVRHRVHLVMAQDKIEGYRRYEAIRGQLPDGLVMAVRMAGIGPFYLPDVEVFDRKGLTDATIARTPVGRTNAERLLAHDREPPAGYLDARGVNIHVGPAKRRLLDAMRTSTFAVRFEEDLWMPLRAMSRSGVQDQFSALPLYRLDWTLLEGDARGNELQARERRWQGDRVLGAFDGATDGWSTEGDMRTLRSEAAIGGGLIGTAAEGETGSARSASFTPQRGQILVFSIAGAKAGVGLRLKADGAEVESWHGRGWRRPRPIAVELAPWRGRKLRLEVYDTSTSGSVQVDHVLLMARR